MGNSAAARTEDASAGAPDTPTGKFAELRTLLLGPEQRQLRALQTRLDDPTTQARDVSRVLPAAVELRANDPHLKRVLAPTIEETISASVRRNPQPLADALFPIIGPAIRKAIAATLSGMLESLNTTLEHSLSWRSLRWRIDARRTGRSFAEIVLLNTLVYRVEQAFLIHRPSGLLLQHVSAPGASVQDGDMVSGMLTAIRDFVQDSFKVSDEEALQTLKVGELSVWIEQGPHALVAAVIRGSAPPVIRATLQQAVESIHAQYSDALASFDGNTSKFEPARPILETCLQQQYRSRERRGRPSPVLVMVMLLVISLLGVWMFSALRARVRWNGYLDALRAQPGIVVVSTDREGGKYIVSGLRDPFAADPASFVSRHNLRADEVVGRWQLYQALDPSLILARARQQLAPPAGVVIKFNDGVLAADGTAPVEWIDRAAGIAPVLAGVTRFDPTGTIDSTLGAMTDSLEATAPLFVKGTTTLTLEGEHAVRTQIARLQAFDTLARIANRQFAVELVGEADADGAPASNLPLSQQRAQRVRGMLLPQQYQRLTITATGIGTRSDANPEAAEPEKQRYRRVSFRLHARDR